MSGVEQSTMHDAHVAAYASHLVRRAHVARLMEMRDEFVQICTQGRFVSAAEKEWRELPRTWRMTLLLVAGVGVETADLDTLAARAWQELPEPEQREVRWVVRDAKRRLGGLTALAARV